MIAVKKRKAGKEKYGYDSNEFCFGVQKLILHEK
jgi:hypothetical protein